uniref:UNC93-like protein n=1 Tax=Biomphalaria glabrata TaxID=6526 RepID=A0A2C9KZ55_BIOGL
MSGSNSTSNTLSPFDLNGLGMGFGLYRPRRPSYTFATKYNRQRSESYRYATRRENPESTSEASNGEDFIEGVLRNKTRRNNLVATATPLRLDEQGSPPKVGVVLSDDDQVAPAKVDHEEDLYVAEDLHRSLHSTSKRDVSLNSLNNHGHLTLQYSSSDDDTCTQININDNHKCSAHRELSANHSATSAARKMKRSKSREDSLEQTKPLAQTKTSQGKSAGSEQSQNAIPAVSFNKNLIILCISFILIFSSFRAIQNLQSSINTENNLGILTMMVVHLSMSLACFLAPIIVNIFTAKWGLCIGILCFLIWFGANFHPTFYTLVPTSLLVGFGQGILWNAESSYILKLAFDSSKVTRGHLDREMFRFHGIFLACFQTTHIWGNLISSLVLSQKSNEILEAVAAPPVEFSASLDYDGVLSNESIDQSTVVVVQSACGALNRCRAPVNIFLNTPPGK